MPWKWKFRSYLENGEDVVRHWYEQLPEVDSVKISAQVSLYMPDSIKKWEWRDQYKRLTDNLEGLEQLRFRFEDQTFSRKAPEITHYRMLGYSEVAVQEFTILIGFKKLRGEGDYLEYGPIAQNRMCAVKANKKCSTLAEWLYED